MLLSFFFFFNDTATTEIYTLSLHDALPISEDPGRRDRRQHARRRLHRAHALSDLRALSQSSRLGADRKSTRLNSSHGYISYAVFCLKKKKKNNVRLHSSVQHITGAQRHHIS